MMLSRCLPSDDSFPVMRTPPKAPAKSPSRSRSPRCTGDAVRGSSLQNDISKGVPLGSYLPFDVCEAVTRTIWAHAKAEAEQAILRASPSPRAVPTPCNASVRSEEQRRRSSSPSTAALATDDAGSNDTSEALTIFPPVGQTQPSQSQPDETTPTNAAVEDITAKALAVLDLAVAPGAALEYSSRVRAMALNAHSYWREVSLDLSKAASSLARFLELQRRLYWRHPPWRGVNLGGWLLLEPGPSEPMFEKYGPAGCEWELMSRMRAAIGDADAQAAMRLHRETFVTENDIRCIRALGLNAVRIPFGYWTIMGAGPDEVYAGPCLEYLDQALSWCESAGLQVLLDLHGAPGGESGERPCGRQQKDWHWENWRFDDSIAALRAIAERYKGHSCVTGISVCNEPSETVPSDVLCSFYDRAVRVIREAGMRPDEVAVVLPVYRTERLDEVWRIWNRKYDGFVRHANVAFDLHMYHCFGPWWQRQGMGSHLRMTKRHRKILRRVPAVVGEWSLALPPNALRCDETHEEDAALQAFSAAQFEAYAQASHGWFFWNWRDGKRVNPGWDAYKCLERNWITKDQMSQVAKERRF